MLGGKTILDPAVIAQGMQNIENSFNGFPARHSGEWGGAAPDQRGGTYRFIEGRLKGLGVNAGVNYRGFKKVGSRDAQLKFGTTTPPWRKRLRRPTIISGCRYLGRKRRGQLHPAVLARCRPVSRSI